MLSLRFIVVNNFKDCLILGGNMRFKALQHLKKEPLENKPEYAAFVPYKDMLDAGNIPDEWVRSAEDLTPEEMEKFVLLDNNNFGEWDYDILANQYDNDILGELGIDIPVYDSAEEEVKEKEVDESLECKNECPKCGYKW